MNPSPEFTVDDAQIWRRRGASAARKLNAAWWLDGFAPAVVGLSLAVMAVILFLRSRGLDIPVWAVGAGIGVLFGLAALFAWLRAKRHFINGAEGMVRLESRLRLHNALSAAEAGVREWPQAVGRADDGLRWRPAWLLVPVIIAAGCLTAAFLVPVPVEASAASAPSALPRSQQQLDEMLKNLEQQQVMKKEDLQKIREQLDQLNKKKPEEWYSHNSLEAADTLKQHLEQSAQNMSQQLDKASQAMESLQKYSEEMTQAERDRLAREYENAVSNLAAGTPGLNQKLMDALKTMDPSAIKSMSKEQLKQMMDGMKQASEACKSCAGGGKKPGNGEGEGEGNGKDMNDLMNDGSGKKGQGQGNGRKPGEGQGEGESEGEGEGAGKGGISRGPGTAPLEIGKGTDLKTENPEGVQSKDFSRALPGDGIGTRDGEHEVDKSPTGPIDGGTASDSGNGGDAVGRESLLPEEKGVLKKYFR